MILLPLLLLTCAGLALLAPLLAGHVVLGAETASSRWRAWLGLAIAFELAAAFPVAALICAFWGPAEWPYYHGAWVFLIGAVTLGARLARAHLRALRGEPLTDPRLGTGALAFALAFSVALLPWVFGAPLPIGGGEFAGEFSTAADAAAYAMVVGPIAGALLVAAWLLRTTGGDTSHRRTEDGVGAALLVAFAAATLWLPRSSLNPRHVAAVERQAALTEANTREERRRTALAKIVRGDAPALLDAPCPSVPEAWATVSRFADAPTDWAMLRQADAAWESRRDVVSLLAPPGVPIDRDDARLAGPRWRQTQLAVAPESWTRPWPERDVWISPATARQRVREAVPDWQLDGSLVITREIPSFASYGRTTLGSVEATLWLWSYREQAFVCAGRTRVEQAPLDGIFHDPDAGTVRGALRMRALAAATAALRAVRR